MRVAPTTSTFCGLFLGLVWSSKLVNGLSAELSTRSLERVFQRSNECTTLPTALLEEDAFLELMMTSNNNNNARIRVSTSFQEQYEIPYELYSQSAARSHLACIDLFDRYSTSLIRCEEVMWMEMSPQDSNRQRQFNVRWEASWISSNSVWLYDLADQVGWRIETKTPDSTTVSTFRWLRVFQMFRKAFQTGTIVLPRYSVEGNTRFTLIQQYAAKDDDQPVAISIDESIDLVEEADSSRLQNRLVAQEFASWLDVSRRPPNTDEIDWASMVRQRILANVPGAGALDVDPNEDGPGVLYAFLVICVASVGILYQTLSGEMMGGQGQVSAQCTDADQLIMGSGYMTECFINGNGPFI